MKTLMLMRLLITRLKRLTLGPMVVKLQDPISQVEIAGAGSQL